MVTKDLGEKAEILATRYKEEGGWVFLMESCRLCVCVCVCHRERRTKLIVHEREA